MVGVNDVLRSKTSAENVVFELLIYHSCGSGAVPVSQHCHEPCG